MLQTHTKKEQIRTRLLLPWLQWPPAVTACNSYLGYDHGVGVNEMRVLNKAYIHFTGLYAISTENVSALQMKKA